MSRPAPVSAISVPSGASEWWAVSVPCAVDIDASTGPNTSASTRTSSGTSRMCGASHVPASGQCPVQRTHERCSSTLLVDVSRQTFVRIGIDDRPDVGGGLVHGSLPAYPSPIAINDAFPPAAVVSVDTTTSCAKRGR